MNICLITDNNYVFYTILCITSICITNNDIPINFFILVNNVSIDNINLLKSFQFDKMKMNIINIDSSFYKNLKTQRYLSYSMFIKFDIPNILKNIDKILYLDGDILVMKSLLNLYNFDICDKYAAVVKDFGKLTIWRDESIYTIKNNTHFYSGQMLMNLKKMRHEKIPDKLHLCKIKHQQYMDEEIFNIVLNDNVKYLDPIYSISYEKILSYRYNQYNDIKIYNDIYNTTYDSIKQMVQNAVIFHFHGDKKYIYKIPTIECIINYILKYVPFIFKRYNK